MFCRQLKMVRGPKSTTAFVEFADVASAMMVHSALQGAVLASSDRGGIRVQYSKNPFGRREMTSSPHTGGIGSPADDGIGLVNSPRVGTAGLLGGMQSATAGAGTMSGLAAASGGFIGQAGLDTVLGNDG
eukprot:GHRR01029185.1.p1 GENE.GHRR01029185.1~~GHRR01029185.1.p1  ORF type:complete len:130 (-),score=53.69 GHRR01029185.1:476-865(-)